MNPNYSYLSETDNENHFGNPFLPYLEDPFLESDLLPISGPEISDFSQIEEPDDANFVFFDQYNLTNNNNNNNINNNNTNNNAFVHDENNMELANRDEQQLLEAADTFTHTWEFTSDTTTLTSPVTDLTPEALLESLTPSTESPFLPSSPRLPETSPEATLKTELPFSIQSFGCSASPASSFAQQPGCSETQNAYTNVSQYETVHTNAQDLARMNARESPCASINLSEGASYQEMQLDTNESPRKYAFSRFNPMKQATTHSQSRLRKYPGHFELTFENINKKFPGLFHDFDRLNATFYRFVRSNKCMTQQMCGCAKSQNSFVTMAKTQALASRRKGKASPPTVRVFHIWEEGSQRSCAIFFEEKNTKQIKDEQ